MFFILACLFLARRYGTSAAPAVSSLTEPLANYAPIFTRDECSNDCSCPGRSTWDIVWSCLATTFTVTWVSIHPNVPWSDESSRTLLKRRVFLMCLALLAPEVMILWAFKQWRGAVMIRQTMNKARPRSSIPWTMAHAHFLQMGGFKLLYQEGPNFKSRYYSRYETEKEGIVVRECVLDFSNFRELLEKRLIVFPDTTAEEIENMSKGDALSKGFALLQTTWFIIQLIARAHQHLTITEIELTTAALAGLNSIMYLFWWSKPLDVRCPIVIRTNAFTAAAAVQRVRNQYDAYIRGDLDRPVRPDGWTFSEDKFRLRDYLRESVLCTPQTLVVRLLRRIRVLLRLLRPRTKKDADPEIELQSSADGPDRRAIKSIWRTGKLVVTKLLYLPYLLVLLPVETIFLPSWPPSLQGYRNTKDKVHSKPALQVLFNEDDMRWIMWMMFYSEPAEATLLLSFSAIAGAAFGSIHCAAWHFDFPSPVERILWQTASLSIVGVCLCLFGGIPLSIFLDKKRMEAPIGSKRELFWNNTKRGLRTIPVTIFLTIVYPLSRLSLLILALISLHNLPDTAFETVTWTKFIPHI